MTDDSSQAPGSGAQLPEPGSAAPAAGPPPPSSYPIFAGLAPVSLARLIGEFETRLYPAGAVIFRQGEPGQEMFVVRAGVAEARAGQGDEGSYPLSLYQTGDSFGELALLTDDPRSTTVVALTDLELWALPKQRFLMLVQQMPGLALAVGRQVSRRLQATHQAVSSMHGAFDAVAEVAYAGLDGELQRFLRRTAPLDPVTPALAARALGRQDADQVLTYLAARLSMVTAEGPGVYRYHRLFRELLDDKLRSELGADGRADWLRYLAECALAVGQIQQAQALLVAVEDWPAATSLAASRARALRTAERWDELERLLSELPPRIDQSHGDLAEARAELLAARGRPADALSVLTEATLAEPVGAAPEARLQRRYRRLAELSFQLGRFDEGTHWLERAGDESTGALGSGAIGTGGLGDGSTARQTRAGPAGEPAARLDRLSALLGSPRLARWLGAALALALAAWFLTTSPPPGLSRQAYLTLGTLAAALPLLVLGTLADHLVTLLLLVAWAGLGLVSPRVALSGFASPGWFLVLSVLAVGVALGRSGLLYRLVLTLLERVPPRHSLLLLALSASGLLLSPAMPNATARTALAAPLAVGVAEGLGYPTRSRGSAAVGLTILLGFGQMCTLFLTGSSSGLLVHSLLPPESQARFSWGAWLVAALPLHLVIFALTFAAILLFLRPEQAPGRPRDTVRLQRQVLGPVSRAEWLTGLVVALMVLAFVFGPLVGLEPAWAAVVAMVVLAAAGVLDQQSFRSGVNWSFLIFFGGMTSLGTVFSAVEVDAWLAALATRPLAPLAATPALFLLALGLTGYLLNLAVRWQAACVLMTLVLVPVVQPLGIEPWVVGITALVTTNMWFLPYQSTIYQAIYYGADEQSFSHAQARPISLVYGLACLLGLLVSVPFWETLGLLP